ncbi:SDR family oxidoreductase [Haloechinothrix salitolerans]|uniref:SDR family oxidoreductase n=1 Tax=Haloechinothrix salitolerans TaxID=926830 RepID=A0ABW2C7K4_9PSEU
MKLREKIVVITGAGGGIGAAMAKRFAREKPGGIVVSDIDAAAAGDVAARVREAGVPVLAHRTDVGDQSQATELIARSEREFGQVDLLCSNAGIAVGMGVHAPRERWSAALSVNVMAHVHLAQAVLPGMAARGSGHVMITASAAGLLGLPGDAPYSVTKAAAVGLAEWLAATYRRSGVTVSALCPLGVRTGLLMPALAAGHPAARAVADFGPLLEAEDVAEHALDGIADERFLILPHPEVAQLYAKKAADPDGWLTELQREGRR